MDGKCGYLAHSPEGWYNALDQLCSNAQLRQDMGDALFTHFNNIASRETVIHNFVDYVKNFKGNKRREEIKIEKIQKPNFLILDSKMFVRKALKYTKAFIWNKSNRISNKLRRRGKN